MEEREYSVLEIVKVNLKYWKVIVVCMAVFAAALGLYQYKNVKPVVVYYEELQQINASYNISNFSNDGIVERLTTTQKIIESYATYEEFIKLSGYDMTFEEFQNFVNFDNAGYVSVQGFYLPYPETYGNLVIETEEDALDAMHYFEEAMTTVCDEYLGKGAVAVLEKGYTTTYTHASAATPTTEADVRNAIIKGMLAGGCLGIALAVIFITFLYLIGTVAKSAKEIEDGLKAPVLGFIRCKRNREEEVKKVRIYFSEKEHCVINYLPYDEKKSDGAKDLAESFEAVGKKVKYIDCTANSKEENVVKQYVMGQAEKEEVEAYLAKEGQENDYIIIKSPDVKNCSDGYQISKLVSENIIAFKRRGVSGTDLYDIKNTIDVNGIHLTGAVIYGN